MSISTPSQARGLETPGGITAGRSEMLPNVCARSADLNHTVSQVNQSKLAKLFVLSGSMRVRPEEAA